MLLTEDWWHSTPLRSVVSKSDHVLESILSVNDFASACDCRLDDSWSIVLIGPGPPAEGDVEIVLGTGGGKFAPPVEIASPDSGFLTAGELNQDGTSGLVAGGAGGGSLFLSGATVAVSPTILKFGDVKVGNSSTPRTVILENNGNAPVETIRLIL
jgi:hypothetical protein